MARIRQHKQQLVAVNQVAHHDPPSGAIAITIEARYRHPLPTPFTVACSNSGYVEPQSVVDVPAVRRTTDRHDVRTKLSQHPRRHLVGGTV